MIENILRDKIPRTLGFVKYFLRIPLASLGSKAQGSIAGTLVVLLESRLQNLLHKAFCHLAAFSNNFPGFSTLKDSLVLVVSDRQL